MAQELDAIDPKTLAWLRPSRSRLPQNPYGQTDFTAYTLEWGEAKLGLASMAVGVLPRTQVGMMVPLSLLGIQNVNGKVNLLRAGPVDLALSGHYYKIGLGDEFKATYAGWGTQASVRVRPNWTLHAGFSSTSIHAVGVPDLSELPGVLTTMAGADLATYTPDTIRDYVDIDAHARAKTARVATDIRLNRRDSIIVQGQGMVWGSLDTGAESGLPPIMGLDVALMDGTEGAVPLSEAYVASASWQLAWKQVELRIGAGVSSVPGAWLLQSTELSYRFGGKTRWQEDRMMRNWRQNKRDALAMN
jgi:hypothetical protein